jgi:hypothetical protein
MPQCSASEAVQSKIKACVQVADHHYGRRKMHDTKLLSEMESAGIPAQGVSANRAAVRGPSRANFWPIVGFCVAGLIVSLFVPAAYLHIEQTSTLVAETPLS